MPTHRLTPEIINAAVAGFEQQKLRIDSQIAELRAMLSGAHAEPAVIPDAPTGKRRKMSAAARKRIGDAQRKRWAASKNGAESANSTVASQPTKAKRQLSAAGKAAIVAALKKRWAAKRAAAKSPSDTPAKKAATSAGTKKATAK